MRRVLLATAIAMLCSGCNTYYYKEFRGSSNRNRHTLSRVTDVTGFYSGTFSNQVYATLLLKGQEAWFVLLFPTNVPDRWPAKTFTTGATPNCAAVWMVNRQKRAPDVPSLVRGESVPGAEPLHGKVKMWWQNQYHFRIEVELKS